VKHAQCAKIEPPSIPSHDRQAIRMWIRACRSCLALLQVEIFAWYVFLSRSILLIYQLHSFSEMVVGYKMKVHRTPNYSDGNFVWRGWQTIWRLIAPYRCPTEWERLWSNHLFSSKINVYSEAMLLLSLQIATIPIFVNYGY